MIVHNLHFVRVSVPPFEADSPLLVDADAVLPLSVPFQGFQPVSRWHPKILEANRSVQKLQFVERRLLDVSWQLSGELALPDPLGFSAFKANDQSHYTTSADISVKRR